MIKLNWQKLVADYPDFLERCISPTQLLRLCVSLLGEIPNAKQYFIDEKQINVLSEYDWCLGILLGYYQRREYEYLVKDWSIFRNLEIENLLLHSPHYFEQPNLNIPSLLPYQWYQLSVRQPQVIKKMENRPRCEWPFNFKVFYLMSHPEFESEFTEWDKIDECDRQQIAYAQPEIYTRHFTSNH